MSTERSPELGVRSRVAAGVYGVSATAGAALSLKSTGTHERSRLVFVDVLRGLAVAMMMVFHTADGWIRPELRVGAIWGLIRFSGGMAAPLFLTVAGLSLALRLAGRHGGGSQTRAEYLRRSVARALQLVVLGYALRLQMWMLDGGGSQLLEAWVAALPLLVAYALAYVGLGRMATGRNHGSPSGAVWPVVLAALLFCAGMRQVALVAPGRLEGLLRVDVLQGLGCSLALVSAIGAVTGLFRGRARLGVLFAIAVACATPAARALVPGPLPAPVAGYLAWWDPGAGRTPAALFPVFPWMAYVFAGAALGTFWTRAARPIRMDARIALLTAGGVLLATASCEALPPAFRVLLEWPMLTQPMRVAYRLGVVLAFAGAALALSRLRALRRLPFWALGRASLLVYWVHLEFAYGMAAKPLARSLDMGQWLLAFTALGAAMTAMAGLRVRASQATAKWVMATRMPSGGQSRGQMRNNWNPIRRVRQLAALEPACRFWLNGAARR